jgi:transcriptional regulator with XRE-family HTH domain
MPISEKIKNLRKSRALSKKALAFELGISVYEYNKIEKDDKWLPYGSILAFTQSQKAISIIEAICSLFTIGIEYFFKSSESRWEMSAIQISDFHLLSRILSRENQYRDKRGKLLYYFKRKGVFKWQVSRS